MNKIEDFFLKVLQNQPKDELQRYIRGFDKSEWQELHELSIKSGLFSAFYKRLTELNLEGPPDDFIALLQNLYFANLKRNIRLEKKMLEIMDFFRENGITAMPLKGPFMARQIYGDIDLRRTSCDLDFLVSRTQFDEAVSVFRKAGYCPSDKKDSNRYYAFCRQIPLQKKEGNDILRIELHWDLRNIFVRTHIDEFLSAAKNIDYSGIQIMAPSNEDLLLYLIFKSVFVFDTNFIDIRYLFDIHNLILKFRDCMDWEALAWKIRRFGFGLHTAYALRYSADFFRTDIPQDFINQFRIPWLKKFLLRKTTDRRGALWSNSRAKKTYAWLFLTKSYLFSDNIFGAVKDILRKMIIAVKLLCSPHTLSAVLIAISYYYATMVSR